MADHTEKLDKLDQIFKAVNGRSPVPKSRGKFKKAEDPAEVAAICRSRQEEGLIAYGLSGRKLAPPDTRIVLVRDLHHAKDVFAECRDTKVCFFDVESSGFDQFTDWVVSYQISPRKGLSYYFPFAHEGFEANLDIELGMGMMADLFLDDTILFGGHGIKFDFKWWLKFGYKLPKPFLPGRGGYRDSMVEAFLTDETRPEGMGLKEITAALLGVKTIKFSELGIAKSRHKVKPGQIPHFGFLNIYRAMEYACPDTDYSLRLDEIFWAIIEKSRYRHVHNYLDGPLVAVLSKMEHRGMAVDREYLATLVKPYQEKISECLVELRRFADDLGFANPADKKGRVELFNPNSGDQLRDVVKRMGITTGKLTKGGKKGIKKVAVDAEVIKKLAPTNPFFKSLGHLRDNEKALGTYVLTLLGLEWDEKTNELIPCHGHMHPITKRVHTSFNQTVADTGRLSSSDPNMQNVPKKSGIAIRRAFVPAPGYRFIRADFSQIELKILAHMAGCQSMIDAFNAKKDFHSVAAIRAFHLDDVDPEGPYVYGSGIKKHPNEAYALLRDKAKAVNFGIVYGISDKGLSIQLECLRPEAKELIKAWFGAFPEIGDWIQKTIKFGRENGFVETMLCRRRRFVRDEAGLYKFGVERQMQNMPIQGTNADMTKWAMVQYDQALEDGGFDAGMVCQIHDELITECREDQVDQVIPIKKAIMEEGLTFFGRIAEAKGKPNPYLLATGCAVECEVQRAWMVTVEKCPHCGRWDGDPVSGAEYRCASCQAVFKL